MLHFFPSCFSFDTILSVCMLNRKPGTSSIQRSFSEFGIVDYVAQKFMNYSLGVECMIVEAAIIFLSAAVSSASI